ncbi:response regulator transcription factor [Fodinibius sediminis]|uniref:DNA-binding response regulator, OmpR family, contains REC and winged-helix (WHTH) domain n=1 Tax=Fodinibius sediminis TaxID=1214077 RepID=A0A521BK42_9BACT|nr:response regulator transcription factor [Fodinibius sediminis]SMO47514.1 DNA-binding response regulator, OmpR family, contains REC and winged-helix (wHTH) domain [Fodinibius sediminis]
MRALIVEDEPLLIEDLEQCLLEEQFYVDSASRLQKATDLIAAEEYDLILLDLGLPDGDGTNLLKLVKKHHPDTAVIIITARGETEDKVRGLELGSDDYLAKPFPIAELRARIHAVLRRKFKINDNKVSGGPLSVNLDHMEVTIRDESIDVTETEYKMLRYLLLNKNKTITRIALAEHIWGNRIDDRFSLDFITSHMKNIRKKLSQAGADNLIETVYGVGYKLVPDETE